MDWNHSQLQDLGLSGSTRPPASCAAPVMHRFIAGSSGGWLVFSWSVGILHGVCHGKVLHIFFIYQGLVSKDKNAFVQLICRLMVQGKPSVFSARIHWYKIHWFVDVMVCSTTNDGNDVFTVCLGGPELNSQAILLKSIISGWWFQTFFIFPPTWGNDPIWLIFFKRVETTN